MSSQQPLPHQLYSGQVQTSCNLTCRSIMNAEWWQISCLNCWEIEHTHKFPVNLYSTRDSIRGERQTMEKPWLFPKGGYPLGNGNVGQDKFTWRFFDFSVSQQSSLFRSALISKMLTIKAKNKYILLDGIANIYWRCTKLLAYLIIIKSCGINIIIILMHEWRNRRGPERWNKCTQWSVREKGIEPNASSPELLLLSNVMWHSLRWSCVQEQCMKSEKRTLHFCRELHCNICMYVGILVRAEAWDLARYHMIGTCVPLNLYAFLERSDFSK